MKLLAICLCLVTLGCSAPQAKKATFAPASSSTKKTQVFATPMPSYASAPKWSTDEDTVIHTSAGDIGFDNVSEYAVDIALVSEIFNRHHRSGPLRKELHLRIFLASFVVRDPDEGFRLSDGSEKDALTGATITGPNVPWVVSAIPTGWKEGEIVYAEKCGIKPVEVLKEMDMTLTMVHELVGHGGLRATNVAASKGEECRAQELERTVLHELAGRVAFRRK